MHFTYIILLHKNSGKWVPLSSPFMDEEAGRGPVTRSKLYNHVMVRRHPGSLTPASALQMSAVDFSCAWAETQAVTG